MAERARFELAEACASAVFKTAALNHSTISPSVSPLNILASGKNASQFQIFSHEKRAPESPCNVFLQSEDQSSSSVWVALNLAMISFATLGGTIS